jgi:4-hydroxy-tetrahydrodipicolinate synthase
MRALRSDPRRDVLSGDDFTFLGLMAQGATGCVSVVSNVDPAGTVLVFREHRAGHVVKAAAALDRLWSLITALFVEPNPVPVKAALAELGLCLGAPRLPLAPYSGPSLRPILTELGL